MNDNTPKINVLHAGIMYGFKETARNGISIDEYSKYLAGLTKEVDNYYNKVETDDGPSME